MRLLRSKLIIIFIFYICNMALAGVLELSLTYCAVTHPFEAMFVSARCDVSDQDELKRERCNNRITCEQQHVIQRQAVSKDKVSSSVIQDVDLSNVAIVPASSHITTDTWAGNGVWLQGKTWENETPFGHILIPYFSDSAQRAMIQSYKLARYQLEPIFLLYNYRTDSWSDFSITMLHWNGIAQLSYLVIGAANTPAKFMRKAAYLVDKKHYILLIEHFTIGFFVLMLESIVALFYYMIGIIVGTYLHPWDTLVSIPSGIVMMIEGIIGGIVDFVLATFDFLMSILFKT